jgi:hypothetical protein
MSVDRMVRGKSHKTWIKSPPEQRQHETWLLARSNRHPIWHFHPDGRLYGCWRIPRGRVVPKRGLATPMACRVPKSRQFASQAGRLLRTGRPWISASRLRCEQTINPMMAGLMEVGNTRGPCCLVQSNNRHTIHIWTTMDSGSKWVAPSPDHVFILFSTLADYLVPC